MAKKCMIERELKRTRLIAKHKQKREKIKEDMRLSNDFEEIINLQLALAKLPINSNPIRHNTRCQQCGRAHAVYRKFGLCRICLRQQLMAGNVAGGRKSSW